MESAETRRSSGHTFARQAGDMDRQQTSSAANAQRAGAKPADPQTGHDAGGGSAADPRQTGAAGDAGRTAVPSRGVIASYMKFKGGTESAEQSGNARQEQKTVPVPPDLMIGANLDIRI